MSAKAIRDASTIGLWYGSTCTSVRKLMFRVRCAAAENSAIGSGEAENFGKKKCSIAEYVSKPSRSAFSICSRTSAYTWAGSLPGHHWSSE